MARPRSVFIPTDPVVLSRIQTAYSDDLAALDAEQAQLEADVAAGVRPAPRYTHEYPSTQRAELAERGIVADLQRFADEPLTGTTRIYMQRIVRRLVDSGRLVRIGNRIKPAPEVQADAT